MNQSDEPAQLPQAVCADCDELTDDFVWEPRYTTEPDQSRKTIHANRHECHGLQAIRRWRNSPEAARRAVVDAEASLIRAREHLAKVEEF